MSVLRWLDPVPAAERMMSLATEGLAVAEQVVSEVPALLTGARRLLSDVSGVVARVDALVTRVDGVVTRVEETVTRADAVVEHCDETRSAADAVVAKVDRVTDRATGLLDRIEPLVLQATPLLEAVARIDPAVVPDALRLLRLSELTDTVLRLRPLLEATSELPPELVRALGKLTPLIASVDELADTQAQQFAASYASVLEQMPKLMTEMSDDIVPAVRVLMDAVPEVQELRQVVDRFEPLIVEVGQVLAGLPGAQRMRRRGEKELDEATSG